MAWEKNKAQLQSKFKEKQPLGLQVPPQKLLDPLNQPQSHLLTGYLDP